MDIVFKCNEIDIWVVRRGVMKCFWIQRKSSDGTCWKQSVQSFRTILLAPLVMGSPGIFLIRRLPAGLRPHTETRSRTPSSYGDSLDILIIRNLPAGYPSYTETPSRTSSLHGNISIALRQVSQRSMRQFLGIFRNYTSFYEPLRPHLSWSLLLCSGGVEAL